MQEYGTTPRAKHLTAGLVHCQSTARNTAAVPVVLGHTDPDRHPVDTAEVAVDMAPLAVGSTLPIAVEASTAGIVRTAVVAVEYNTAVVSNWKLGMPE